ncbi:sensor domain-containing protein [Pseudoalteromonas piratica]|uniref:Diguanylate phosphodiesterase n=1 Tax=Pseudoalteromonas piratica TaxID=1348114 RepID=A0A0A7EEK9_9GAMM|nr:EAL domain-containing protein [Pseudoalteromonas piratica]AIY64983.1 diguanylate phosphodiesterase [Pseudoalteromonas piratica]
MPKKIIKIIAGFTGLFTAFACYAHQPTLLDSDLLIPLTLASLSLMVALVAVLRLRKSQVALKRSEHRFKNSILASGDAVWDWHINEQRLERINDGLFNAIDHTQDFPPNRSNIHPSDIEFVEHSLKKHLSGETTHFEASYRAKDATGNWRWVLDKGRVIETDSQLKPMRMMGTVKDIGSIKQTQERLNLLANCIENLSDPIVIFDSNFTIVEVNKTFLDYFGGNATNHIGMLYKLPGHDKRQTQQFYQSIRKASHWHKELTLNKEKQNTFFSLSIDRIDDTKNNLRHYIAVYNDITDNKQTELALQKLTNRDRLTGLPNRNQFFTNMKSLVSSKNRHALLVFDLDNFKKINDSLGHHAGDILLCRLASRLSKRTRERDQFYRLGGDEFALVMQNTNDIHTITQAAKNFLALIEAPFHMSGHELVITSSVGIVLFPEDGNTPELLLKNADTAMYHAKQHGNRYLFFNDAMNRQAVKRLQIENLIRYGLKEDHFKVFYQPKMDINSGELVGMEALVRFITPNKGLISPAQFIPIAEETGQIVEVGEVVLEKACRDVKDWINRGLFDGRVAVNLSAKQFMQPDLIGSIDKILKREGLASYYLELEITEGTIMEDPKDAIRIMNTLSARGIHLAIDDFGTGYSSLAYLKQFPLNTLKVDKAFIDDMGNEKGKNMVDSIVTIAHNLGLSVVAEGVEYADQVEQLKELNCATVQGYFYSKPLSHEQFEQFLLAHCKKAHQPHREIEKEVKLSLVQ